MVRSGNVHQCALDYDLMLTDRDRSAHVAARLKSLDFCCHRGKKNTSKEHEGGACYKNAPAYKFCNRGL